MKDMKASAERLRIEAEDAALIAKLATDKQKRELYQRLAEHYTRLAIEVEKVMAERRAEA